MILPLPFLICRRKVQLVLGIFITVVFSACCAVRKPIHAHDVAAGLSEDRNSRGAKETPRKALGDEVVDSQAAEEQLDRLRNQIANCRPDQRIALHKELLKCLWSLREKIGRGELSHDYLSSPLSLYELAGPIGWREFKLKILVSFCRQPDVNPEALYEAYRIFTNGVFLDGEDKLTLAEATRLHDALRVAHKTKHKGMEGEFTDNKVVQYAIALESEFPTLNPIVFNMTVSPDALTVGRIGHLGMPAGKEPPKSFGDHYMSARWYEERLWIFASVDGKWGILSLDVETNESDFIELPASDRQESYSDDRFLVTKDAIFIGRDWRVASETNGLLRYDRHAKTWRTYPKVHRLSSGYEPDMVFVDGFIYMPYYFDDRTLQRNPKGVARIDTVSGEMELLTSTVRDPQKTPLDRTDIGISGLFAGSDGLVYVKARKARRDDDYVAKMVYSFAPKTGEWREVRPTEYTVARRGNVDLPVFNAGGGDAYNWPEMKNVPEHWADDRDSWHGQPTRGLRYGDRETQGIVDIPLRFAPDLDVYRRLSGSGKIPDKQVLSNISQETDAWLITPKGILFRTRATFWYFLKASEIRAAAMKLAAGGDSKAPLWRESAKVSSPDEQLVTFCSDRDGNRDIFIANADGSGSLINLTDSWDDDRAPSFSVDGKEVIYQTRHDDEWVSKAINIKTRAVLPVTAPAEDNAGARER